MRTITQDGIVSSRRWHTSLWVLRRVPDDPDAPSTVGQTTCTGAVWWVEGYRIRPRGITCWSLVPFCDQAAARRFFRRQRRA